MRELLIVILKYFIPNMLEYLIKLKMILWRVQHDNKLGSRVKLGDVSRLPSYLPNFYASELPK